MVTAPVVVGVDHDSADSAVDWAAHEARARKAQLIIVGAFEPPVVTGWSAEQAAEIDRAVLHTTQTTVDRLIKSIRSADPSLQVAGEVVQQQAAKLLIDRSADASVLVVGTHRRGVANTVFFGSVSSSVVGRAHCPVVVVPQLTPDNPPSVPARRVVAGIEATAESKTVLGFAFEHAARHSLDLEVVMCARPDMLTTPEGSWAKLLRNHMQPWLSEALAGWRTQYPDVSVREKVIVDHAAPALTNEAADAALLVVGKHSHSALTATLLGSVSQSLIHHARCPVAVVPV